MNKKVLVCIAGSFIGGHVVRWLKREGAWVRGVDLKPKEFRETEADDLTRREFGCAPSAGPRTELEITFSWIEAQVRRNAV